MNCIVCNIETTNPKFCSRSCAATHNNQGKQRHGKEMTACEYCNSPTRRKYCSNTCSAASRKVSDDHIRKSNADRQSRYRAKKYRTLDSSADKQKIKEIYLNCPFGYEVDHIIPLSKGGKHHEDNLQYLTIKENRSKGSKLWYAERDSNPHRF